MWNFPTEMKPTIPTPSLIDIQQRYIYGSLTSSAKSEDDVNISLKLLLPLTNYYLFING